MDDDNDFRFLIQSSRDSWPFLRINDMLLGKLSFKNLLIFKNLMKFFEFWELKSLHVRFVVAFFEGQQ